MTFQQQEESDRRYQQGQWEGMMKAVSLLLQCGWWPRSPHTLATYIEYAAQPWKPKEPRR